MKFRDLDVGQSFDWINDAEPMLPSFWDRCEKTSQRTYRSLSTNHKYRVGSINATVHHPGVPTPINASHYLALTYLASRDVLAVKRTEAPRFHSATGYGRAIPTQHMVQLADKRWRRVYLCCFSNAGTAYIKTKANAFTVIGPDVEALINPGGPK